MRGAPPCQIWISSGVPFQVCLAVQNDSKAWGTFQRATTCPSSLLARSRRPQRLPRQDTSACRWSSRTTPVGIGQG
eukprot:7066574-Alexandrium_andersonii.AAC.1